MAVLVYAVIRRVVEAQVIAVFENRRFATQHMRFSSQM